MGNTQTAFKGLPQEEASTPDRRSRELLSHPFVQGVGLALAYFATAHLSSWLSVNPKGLPVFWAPSGLLVASLLLVPTQSWVFLLAAASAADVAFQMLHGGWVSWACLLALSNVVEGLVGAWLARRFVGYRPSFATLREVLIFTLLSPIVGAAVGAAIRIGMTPAGFGGEFSWGLWGLGWTSHSLGIIVLVPLLLTWFPKGWAGLGDLTGWRLVEAVLVMAVLLACSTTLFSGWSSWPMFRRGFLSVPALIWAALRFGPRGASATILPHCLLGVGLSTRGMGGFAIRPGGEPGDIATLQYMLITYFVTSLAAAAIVRQRERASLAAQASEKALREKTEELDRYFNLSLDLFCIANTAGHFLRLNPEWERTLGYRIEDLEGRKFMDFVHPDDVDATLAAVADLAGGKRVLNFVNRYRCKDGSYRWIEWRSVPFGEGMICAAARDVTERRKTEESLRQSQVFIESIIEHSPHSMWISDDKGNMIRMNQACRDMLHVSDDEVVGKYNLLRDNIVAEQGLMPMVRRVFEEGQPVQFSLLYDTSQLDQIRFRSQASVVLEVTITPVLDARGKVRNAIIQHIDITERRRAEEALQKNVSEMQSMLKNMLNAFIVWESVFDERGKFVSFRFGYFNDAFARVSGLKYEDVCGKDVFEVWPETEQSWVDTYGAVAMTGVPMSFEMYHSPTKGLYFCNAYRPSDSPDRVCVIFEDITEKRRAEAERIRLEGQLAQAQKMESIGQLAGGVAHDFNNLLSVILGYGELMAEDLPVQSPARESLAQIVRAGERAKDLTRQLLAFSRKQMLEMKPLELNSMVHGVEKMIRRLLGEHIQVEVITNPKAGHVNGDLSQLEQVFMNLCVNARDAMPNGGVLTIETGLVHMDDHYVSAHPGLQPGLHALLSVSDTGCGMDDETVRRVFDPFFTTKEKGKGTGLGLATAYGIIRQHGGDIGVYSEKDHGSTFRIYLPQLQDASVEQQTLLSETTVLGRGETILVMEDEEAVRKLTCRMLTRLGYSVIEAHSIAECIELARQTERLDLLLTDVVMPGMNGRQLHEQVASIRPGTRVLFMSGYTENVIAHHGILDEGIHFISKPFTESGLSRKIREALTA